MKENLHQEIERLEKSNTQLEHKLKRKRVFLPLISILVIIFWIGMYFVLKNNSISAIERKKNEILSETLSGNAYEIASAFDMSFFDQDTTIDFFEKSFLGNTNDVLINGGKAYVSDSFKMFGNSDESITLLGYNYVTNEDSVSYINKVTNGVCYRNDKDKLFYFQDDNGRKESLFDKAMVGQTIVFGSSAFFINLSDNNSLYYGDFNSNEIKKVFDTCVRNFAIVGRCIFILTSDNRLIVYDFYADETINTITDVDSFTIKDGLYIQQGNSVLFCSLSMKKQKKKYSLASDDVLISVSSDSLFFRTATTIQKTNKKTGQSKSIWNNNDQKTAVLRGIYTADDIIMWLGMADYENAEYNEFFYVYDKFEQEGSK